VRYGRELADDPSATVALLSFEALGALRRYYRGPARRVRDYPRPDEVDTRIFESQFVMTHTDLVLTCEGGSALPFRRATEELAVAVRDAKEFYDLTPVIRAHGLCDPGLTAFVATDGRFSLYCRHLGGDLVQGHERFRFRVLVRP
jgi:hypothetical protein